MCFFAQLAFSQTTTWDGATWDNGNPDNITDVIFTGNYSSLGNLTAKSVTVNSPAIVTFNSSHTLTVQNDITVMSGSSLIFENNASLLQINGSAINTGNITYKRDATPMIENQYTYWGAPVSGQVLNIFSPLTSPSRFHSFNAN